MKASPWLPNLLSFFLPLLGIAIAATALRHHYGWALGIYIAAQLLGWLARTEASWELDQDAFSLAIQHSTRRIFWLLVLTTLHTLGSCPTWFLALVISASLLQALAFLFIRPVRLSTPVLPEISLWNSIAQTAIPGIFLVDLLLIQRFPANFRFSESFHLAGYAFMASIQLMHLAHECYRFRRSLVFWFRALRFQ